MRPFFFEGSRGAKENNDLENEMAHDFPSFFFHGKGALPMIMIVSFTKKRSEEMVT